MQQIERSKTITYRWCKTEHIEALEEQEANDPAHLPVETTKED